MAEWACGHVSKTRPEKQEEYKISQGEKETQTKVPTVLMRW